MSIVNSVKGFVRSVLGIPPLTLPDCVDEDSLINYTISGNSVQNGTPTPENPVEVESVGEKTKNLFEIRTPDLVGQAAHNGYGGTNHTVYDYGIRITKYAGIGFWFNDLEVGSKYTLSCKLLTSGTSSGVFFVIGQNQGQSATSTTKNLAYTGTLKEGIRVVLTFTADETNLLSFGLGDSTPIEIGEIQLEKGSSRTDYEPYGYKIPVKCSGKNLFDSSKYWNIYATDVADGYGGYNVTKIDGGVKIARNSSAGWSNDIVGLEPNTTYTVSFKAKTAQGGTNYIVISVDKKLYYKYMYAATTSTLTQTFTTDGSPSAFGFAHSNYTLSSGMASTLEITDIMLVKGSTVTDYEPYVKPVTTNIYLDKPLAEGETLKNPVKLPTVKGTTIYTIGTGVQPKNMSATYYSTRKD